MRLITDAFLGLIMFCNNIIYWKAIISYELCYKWLLILNHFTLWRMAVFLLNLNIFFDDFYFLVFINKLNINVIINRHIYQEAIFWINYFKIIYIIVWYVYLVCRMVFRGLVKIFFIFILILIHTVIRNFILIECIIIFIKFITCNFLMLLFWVFSQVIW